MKRKIQGERRRDREDVEAGKKQIMNTIAKRGELVTPKL
jgi:hypothetical protein